MRRYRAFADHRGAELDAPDEEVLVWSDLHLGHANIPDSVLVLVGDVAVGEGVCHAHWDRVRHSPGREKHLVIGNHDLTGLGELRAEGFDSVWSVMTLSGDPPLVWTHYPLREVPEGYVNIHGHVHGTGLRRSAAARIGAPRRTPTLVDAHAATDHDPSREQEEPRCRQPARPCRGRCSAKHNASSKQSPRSTPSCCSVPAHEASTTDTATSTSPSSVPPPIARCATRAAHSPRQVKRSRSYPSTRPRFARTATPRTASSGPSSSTGSRSPAPGTGHDIDVRQPTWTTRPSPTDSRAAPRTPMERFATSPEQKPEGAEGTNQGASNALRAGEHAAKAILALYGLTPRKTHGVLELAKQLRNARKGAADQAQREALAQQIDELNGNAEKLATADYASEIVEPTQTTEQRLARAARLAERCIDLYAQQATRPSREPTTPPDAQARALEQIADTFHGSAKSLHKQPDRSDLRPETNTAIELVCTTAAIAPSRLPRVKSTPSETPTGTGPQGPARSATTDRNCRARTDAIRELENAGMDTAQAEAVVTTNRGRRHVAMFPNLYSPGLDGSRNVIAS